MCPTKRFSAVPVQTLTRDYDDIHDLEDVSRSRIDLIEHFFAHYKDLEGGKFVQIDRWGSAGEAAAMIAEARDRMSPVITP